MQSFYNYTYFTILLLEKCKKKKEICCYNNIIKNKIFNVMMIIMNKNFNLLTRSKLIQNIVIIYIQA